MYVQINAKDKAAQYLNIPPATHEIQSPLPNLYTVNITPEAAMKEYVLMQIRLEVVYRLVFENRAVKYFLRVVPALNDLVVLGKIHFHEQERDRHGKPKYDVILVDAQPTGHGLFLLKLPFLMRKAVSGGPVLREASAMLDMLRDERRTGIVLVTLPEEMPVTESLETFLYCARRIPNARQRPVIVNQVIRSGFTQEEGALLRSLLENPTENDPPVTALEAARETLVREEAQTPYLRQIETELPLPVVHLPRIVAPSFGPAELNRLAEPLSNALLGESR